MLRPQNAPNPLSGQRPSSVAGRQTPFRSALDEQVETRDGSRAIEVVSLFEDAILDVRYLGKPSPRSRRTLGYLAGGAAAVIGALGMLVVSFVQVGHGREARADWERRHPDGPAYSVPSEGSAGDIVAATLLVAGLGLVLRGLQRRSSEQIGRRRREDFTLGTEPAVDFAVPAGLLPLGEFPLVHICGQGHEVLLSDRMSSEAWLGGQAISSDELRARGLLRDGGPGGARGILLAGDLRVRIELGENTFIIQPVASPRQHPVPLRPDWNALAYTGATGAGFGVFLALVFSIPEDARALSLDSHMLSDRRFVIIPPAERKDDVPAWLRREPVQDATQKLPSAAVRPGPAKNRDATYTMRKRSNGVATPDQTRALAATAAKDAGILNFLRQGGQVASIFSRESAFTADVETAFGSLVGTQVGDAYGASGGIAGVIPGGGSTGSSTIALGDIPGLGPNARDADARYRRSPGARLTSHVARDPDIIGCGRSEDGEGCLRVRGSIDKEIIRRVVRRHLNEVKFCYERELARSPDIQGRVAIQFTIGGTGGVISSVVQTSTLGSPAVERCIADAVRRWEFPKPAASVVMVSYPFMLRASGTD